MQCFFCDHRFENRFAYTSGFIGKISKDIRRWFVFVDFRSTEKESEIGQANSPLGSKYRQITVDHEGYSARYDGKFRVSKHNQLIILESNEERSLEISHFSKIDLHSSGKLVDDARRS